MNPNHPLRPEKRVLSSAHPFPIRTSQSLVPDPRGRPIIVSKFSGWGSLLNTAPILSGLRSRYPDSPLILLTDQRNEELVRRLTLVDRPIFLSTSRKGLGVPIGNLLRVGLLLRHLSPGFFLDLQLHSRKRLSTFLALSSGADTRIGFIGSRDKRRIGQLTHALYFNSHQPVQAAFDQVSRLLGLQAFSPEHWLLQERPEDSNFIESLLPEMRSPQTLLCLVNPNASDLSYERRWPAEYHKDACRRLLDADPSRVIALTGSLEEKPYVDAIERGIPSQLKSRVKNLAGRLTFGNLVALLKRSKIFLTNDSGPLHLALMIGTPTVALFGPTHPGLVPFSHATCKTIFLYAPLYCSPCVHQAPSPPCGGNNLCMQAITVDSVVRAVEALLDRRHRPLSPIPQAYHTPSIDSSGAIGKIPVALFRTEDGPPREHLPPLDLSFEASPNRDGSTA